MKAVTMDSLLESLDEATRDCISCGFCESVCPTLPASGYDLSRGARGRVLLGKSLYTDLSEKGSTEIDASDPFYSCLDCFACVQICPAGVNAGEVSHIVKGIIAMQDSPLEDQEKNVARMIVNATMKFGNPLGLRRKSAKWAGELEFSRDSGTLLYTGNMYQLMEYSSSMGRMRERFGTAASDRLAGLLSRFPGVMKASAMLHDSSIRAEMEEALRNIHWMLSRAGVEFRYLGKDEPYPGTFLYDLGYLKEFGEYAQRVAEQFHSEGITRIITTDPHSHNVLKNLYPQFVDGFTQEVVYYLDLIDVPVQEKKECVTYHEPCYFTLRGEDYGRPRELISRSAEVRSHRRSGKSNFCCGGPAELLHPGIADGVSSMRGEQLKSMGSARTVTACPICYANLKDKSGAMDIANYLRERMDHLESS